MAPKINKLGGSKGGGRGQPDETSADFLEMAILCKCLLDPNEYLELVLRGKLRSNVFSAEHAIVLNTMIAYYKNYNAMPALSALQRDLEKYHITLNFEPELYDHKALYYWHKLLHVKLLQESQRTIANTNNSELSIDNIRPALVNLVDTLNKQIRDYDINTKVPRPLMEIYPDVIAEYVAKKEDTLQGVKIPFQHLRDFIGVWGPGEISACVARTNVGKTWWTILNTLAAAEQGYTCLYSSKEMLESRIGRRLFTVDAKVDYDKFIKATLTDAEFDAFDTLIKGRSDVLNRIIVADPQTLDSPDSLELYIKQYNPFFVVVDAFYMFQNVPGTELWQKVSHLLKVFKNLATKTNTHIQLTSQFNKSGSNRRKTNEFAVAFSDAINQDVDFRIDLFQNTTLAKMYQVEMTIGKGRESQKGVTVVYNWNFFKMDFSCTGNVVENVVDEDNPFTNM